MKFSASTSSINFIGSWSVSSLVFPTREEGFAFVDGSLRNTMSTLMERTTDGGRTWLAMREQTSISNAAPTNLAFNSASDGWWYGFTVLRRTTDSGRSWQEVPTTGDVISLVTSGPRTWMVASVGPIPRNGRCHSEVLSSNGPKELPTPLKRQPQLGTSCNWQLLSVSLSTVYLSESSQGAAPSYYWATTDFGQAWVKRATPCNDARRFGSFDLTGAKNALWLLCPTGPVDNMPALQPMRLYVSSNNGNSWQLTWKGWFQLGEVVVTAAGRHGCGLSGGELSPETSTARLMPASSGPMSSRTGVRTPSRHHSSVAPISCCLNLSLLMATVRRWQWTLCALWLLAISTTSLWGPPTPAARLGVGRTCATCHYPSAPPNPRRQRSDGHPFVAQAYEPCFRALAS